MRFSVTYGRIQNKAATNLISGVSNGPRVAPIPRGAAPGLWGRHELIVVLSALPPLGFGEQVFDAHLEIGKNRAAG